MTKSTTIGILLAFAFSFATAGAQTAKTEPDEAYFLVRALECLYEQWPQNISDPDAFSDAAIGLRKQAIHLRIRAEEASLPPAIVARYNDFVGLLDSYTDFLRNVGAIRRTARDNANKESFTSGFEAGYAGAGTFGVLSQRKGVATRDAALASILVGGITYALDAWGKSSQRDEAERSAVAASAQQVEDRFTETLERTKESFLKIAADRGWDERELGWDLSATRATTALESYRSGNASSLLREYERQRTLRPKDPFVRLGHNLLQATVDEKNTALLLRLSEDSRNASTLIPQAPAYSQYRLQCAIQAAYIATGAREAEKRREPGLRSTATSRRALELWDEVLRLDFSGPTDYNRLGHAVARFDDGDARGARSEAEGVIQRLASDANVLLNYVCILSADKDYDDALKVLQAALATGTVDLADVRVDPDLFSLAAARKDSFQKLTTPQWSWTTTDDWLNDDVILKNESAFPLTNVVFSATLKKGDKTRTISLRCNRIPAGESQKWSNAVETAGGGAWEGRSTASLSCDQSPK